MGMFDTVMYTCPSCGAHMSEQTKLGECTLAEYRMTARDTDIPEALLLELAEQQSQDPIDCSGCGLKLRIVINQKPVATLQVARDKRCVFCDRYLDYDGECPVGH